MPVLGDRHGARRGVADRERVGDVIVLPQHAPVAEHMLPRERERVQRVDHVLCDLHTQRVDLDSEGREDALFALALGEALRVHREHVHVAVHEAALQPRGALCGQRPEHLLEFAVPRVLELRQKYAHTGALTTTTGHRCNQTIQPKRAAGRQGHTGRDLRLDGEERKAEVVLDGYTEAEVVELRTKRECGRRVGAGAARSTDTEWRCAGARPGGVPGSV